MSATSAARAPHSTLRERGQLTLPQRVRQSLGLAPGDTVLFVETEQGWALRRGQIVAADAPRRREESEP